jgi:phospholipase C
MEPFSPEQVPVISTLARNYAISDAWFCSVPSQTWPTVHLSTPGLSAALVSKSGSLDAI